VRLPETRDLFERELQFPVTRERVVERVGERRLEAPNGSDTTAGAVLNHCTGGEFASADALYDSLVVHVEDGFVGRKRYDDRETTTNCPSDGRPSAESPIPARPDTVHSA
jgi:hypothetical protein